MTTDNNEPVTATVRVGQTDPDTKKDLDAALAALDAAVPVESAPAEEPAPTPAPEDVPPCGRCGHSVGGSNKPQESDLQEYIRSILGSRQFAKTYKLMGGRILFQYSTLDGSTSDHLNNVIIAMNHFDDAIKYNAIVLKYRILFTLREYTIGGQATELPAPTVEELPPGDFDAVNALFKQRIEHLDQGIVQMIAQSLMLFRSLEAALIEGAFDETFWKGAGPC